MFGSYSVEISLLFFYVFYGLSDVDFDVSADLLAPMFKFIFLEVSILFSFEFILANVNFFLSTGAFVITVLYVFYYLVCYFY